MSIINDQMSEGSRDHLSMLEVSRRIRTSDKKPSQISIVSQIFPIQEMEESNEDHESGSKKTDKIGKNGKPPKIPSPKSANESVSKINETAISDPNKPVLVRNSSYCDESVLGIENFRAIRSRSGSRSVTTIQPSMTSDMLKNRLQQNPGSSNFLNVANLNVPQAGGNYRALSRQSSFNGSFADLDMTGRFDDDDFNGNLLVKLTNVMNLTTDECGYENVNEYQLMQNIGDGAFAKVMKAKYSTTGSKRLNLKGTDAKKVFVSFRGLKVVTF